MLQNASVLGYTVVGAGIGNCANKRMFTQFRIICITDEHIPGDVLFAFLYNGKKREQ